MHTCPSCAVEIELDALECSSCGQQFSAPAGRQKVLIDEFKRPSGKGQLDLAILLAAGTLAASGIGFATGNEWHSIVAFIIAGGLFQLCLICWGVGSILRGLWFLDGVASKELITPVRD